MGGTESTPQEEPEPGDMIEISRGLFNHWGVCIGDKKVVHLTVPDGVSGASISSVPSVHTKNGEVKIERLSKVAAGGKYRISRKYDQKYKRRPVEEIVRDAEAKEGQQVDYNLLGNNCEHFATGLCHGVRRSEQVDTGLTVSSAIGAGMAVATIGAAALAVFGTQKPQQRR